MRPLSNFFLNYLCSSKIWKGLNSSGPDSRGTCGKTSIYKTLHDSCNTWANLTIQSLYCLAPSKVTHFCHGDDIHIVSIHGSLHPGRRYSQDPKDHLKRKTDLSWKVHLAPNPVKLTITCYSSTRLSKASNLLFKTLPPIQNYHYDTRFLTNLPADKKYFRMYSR